MKFLKSGLLLLLLAPALFGQSAQRSNTAIITNSAGYVSIIPNASVYICQYNSELSCITPVAVYSDPALTSPISQPVIANAAGVYNFYITNGTQVVEKVCAPYAQCYSIGLTIGTYGAGSPGVTSINSVLGPFTFSGSGVNCSGTTCTFNGGSGSGTVQPANQYSPAFYTQSGSTATVGGTSPFTGLEWFPGSSPPQAATLTNLQTVAGFTFCNPTSASQYNLLFYNTSGVPCSPATISTDGTGTNLIVPGAVTAKTVGTIYTVTSLATLTAAIASVTSAGGGTINVGDGNYVLTSGLTVPSNTTIQCQSWNAHLTMPGLAGTVNMLSIGSSSAGVNNVKIRGCFLDGTGMSAGSDDAIVIYVPQANNVEIEGNLIEECPEDCVRLGTNTTGSFYPTNVRIYSNHFLDAGTTGPSGSFVGATAGVHVNVQNNTGYGALLTAVDDEPMSATSNLGTDWSIANNTFYGVGTTITSSGTCIQELAASPAVGLRVTITGNVCNGFGGNDGIAIEGTGVGQVTVSGNTVQGSINGLHIKNATGVVTSANVFSNASGAAILTDGPSAVGNQLGGNILQLSANGINEINSAGANSYLGATFGGNTANIGTLGSSSGNYSIVSWLNVSGALQVQTGAEIAGYFTDGTQSAYILPDSPSAGFNPIVGAHDTAYVGSSVVDLVPSSTSSIGLRCVGSPALCTASGEWNFAQGPIQLAENIILPSSLVGYSSDGGSGTSPTVAIAIGRPANGCATWSTGSITSTGTACGSGGSGDTITSPNNTLAVGGTTTNTTLDVANAVTFNNSGTGAASGTTYNGSTARTISYNTIGASPTAGSTSLTTLGTVTTGTWNGTAVGTQYGGTGQNWSSSNGIPELAGGAFSLFNTTCSSASNALTWNSTTHAIGCNSITVSNVPLSSITAATGSNTLSSANNGSQVWNWALTSNSETAFTFGETSAATGTGDEILAVSTLAGSTAVPVTITDSLTGSQTLPALQVLPTWNTTGAVDAAILVNATNTASGAGSKLIDLQVGGTSQASVDKSGNLALLGSISTGSSAPSCGSATGCIAMTEASTAGTPASGVDYIRASSATHQFLGSLNNGAEFVSAMNYAIGTSGGTVPLLNTANTWGALQTFGLNASLGTTAHGVLLSENTSAIAVTAAGTSGQPLLSGGSSGDPSYGTLGIGAGGTGATTAANALINLFPTATRVGDVIYCATYSGTCTSWALLAGNNSGTNFLEENSSGVPSWGAGGGGDSITSPNATITVGGTSSATTLDVAGAAGKILAGATPALTATPALGTDNSIAGTLQLSNGSANAHTIFGSAATTSNTVNFFATVPTNLHLFYCAVSSTICTLTDTGYAYNSIPAADIAAGALANGMTATTQSAGDSSTDLATDSFVTTAVNNAIAGVNPAVAVLAASTANVTGTYTQVGGGIGDTFTVTATGAFTLDGIAINTIGQRVLLKNQTSANQNGIYTATVVGTTGVSPVFTRAIDYDTPSDVNNTGSIPVQSGTVNSTTSWLLTSQVTSIGSSGSSLTYVQFSLNPSTLVTSAAALTSNQAMNGLGSQSSGTGFSDTAGTITTGNLACYTSSNTVGNCASASANNILGVFNTSTTWIASGEVSVNLDTTVNVTFGDILCVSTTTAGTAHDNGSVSCNPQERVGVVKTTASSVTSATAFIELE